VNNEFRRPTSKQVGNDQTCNKVPTQSALAQEPLHISSVMLGNRVRAPGAPAFLNMLQNRSVLVMCVTGRAGREGPGADKASIWWSDMPWPSDGECFDEVSHEGRERDCTQTAGEAGL
jgi:hypothetical protein